jgi:Ca2+-binding RTX toxin-like protein
MARRSTLIALLAVIIGVGTVGPVAAYAELSNTLRRVPVKQLKKKKAKAIVGTKKSETIKGTSGNDRILAKGGNDKVDGGDGDDTISGDAGNDRLIGGPGSDILLGGGGNDRIYARDGERDTIACGRGRDIAYVDAVDVVTGECEVVRVARR